MKLKQKLAIGLSTFYLFSVIGVGLSMHFCGGKLASVAFYENKTACKYCKQEPVAKKDDGCCKNTKVDVKVKDSHQTESSFKLPKLFSLDTYLHPRVSEVIKYFLPNLFSRLENKAPPKSTGVAIHVFNCVFRN
ncbi:hypothetical protein [Pedobacter sp. Hv1]|uniref:HYC_CC_PP family protein n=1 Tax=Pedobacter sp. Hv1 TaxID=1740090 RepID=UPI0006D8B4D4|nr:hypothetical protein [Pedobacter sp. Hv1]KQB98760.1 hypothetical protein AQF98_20675 [Pedobacter sp. Hv1]